jgi:cytochrome c oxidase cbb3-type subunit 3
VYRLLLLTVCLFTIACLPHPSNKSPVKANEFSSLYGQNCAGCHGADGKNGPARPLHDPVFVAYMPADHIKLVIENGRTGTPMPPFGRAQGGPLDEGQVDAIVKGIESWGKPIGAIPSYTAATTGDPHNGAKLFAQNCFMCHAKGAAVGPVTDTAYLTLVSDQSIRSSIVTGRPDLGMPDWRHLHMGKALSDQEITDLASYLASLRPANPGSDANRSSGTSSTIGGPQQSAENNATRKTGNKQ